MTAQYLLRFDDLCPTMDRAAWQRFAPLLRRFAIHPILAVVPDNQDPQLRLSERDPNFWAAMRTWQASGATIGLHGFKHICAATGPGFVPLHDKTEFAGASLEDQRSWIQSGLDIFAAQGLAAQIWVAPRHGFDAKTLTVLHEQGIGALSDGLALRPFRKSGVIWIPQQLWSPIEKQSGLWTICIHSNTATDKAVRDLETFLDRFAGQFTSVDRVLKEWPIAAPSFSDSVFHAKTMLQMRLRKLRRNP